MSGKKRKMVIIGASVVGALVILCVWVVPMLVDVNRYRPQVAELLEQKTGKPARIGHLELTLFPHLAIEVDNFALGNPKGFPSGDFINTRRIYAVLNAGALRDRRIVIESLVVEDPVIHLLSAPDGRWNFENPPAAASAANVPARAKPASFSLETISTITLDGGVITVANLLPSRQAGPTYFEGHGISCRFIDVNVSAATASGAPQAMTDRPKPSLLSLLGFPSTVYAAVNAPQPIAHGSFKAEMLRFGAVKASAVDSQVWVFPKQVFLDNLTLKLAGGSVKGKADLKFSGQNPRYNIRTIFNNIDLAQLSQAFPNARGKITGTMQGNFNLQGEASHSTDPLSGLQGTGDVIVRNGRLPSLQLSRNLMTLVRVAGLGSTSGDPASFSVISADLNVANQLLTGQNIKVVSNDLDVDGSGTLALVGARKMDFNGTAKLAARQTGLTDLLANISGAQFSNGKLAFPFVLQGTLENPRFRLKSGQGVLGGLSNLPGASKTSPAAGSQGNQPGNLVQGITNLFRKKKAPAQPPKP